MFKEFTTAAREAILDDLASEAAALASDKVEVRGGKVEQMNKAYRAAYAALIDAVATDTDEELVRWYTVNERAWDMRRARTAQRDAAERRDN